jgi:hypothetical protein
MKLISAAPALAAAFVFSASAQPATCRQQVGPQASALYVRQCLQVSPSSRPPCNPANPCDVMVAEIKRGCGLLHVPSSASSSQPSGSSGMEPHFCAQYLAASH